MHFQVLTIFPELFQPFSRLGLLGKACEQGTVKISPVQLRQYAINAHGQIDDAPYGGGSGMVLRPEPAFAAIAEAKVKAPRAKVVLLTPRGTPLCSSLARELAAESKTPEGGLILLAYRYEGVDERIAESSCDYQISLGDFVLQGGEVAAMALIEAVTRFIPDVLGNPQSTVEESFQSGLLEYPQYTRPERFQEQQVPEVLLTGHHAQVAQWRENRAFIDTLQRRPDLIAAKYHSPPQVEVSVVLLHYPVYNKAGEIITSSVTNLDIHDIARSARTYGLTRYYVVHPTRAMRRLLERICEHWTTGYGSTYNCNRSEALSLLKIVPDFDEVLSDIEQRTGKLPKTIATSAKTSVGALSYLELKARICRDNTPHLLLLGTGWGLSEEILQRASYQLAPVEGFTDWNHLSVRAAAAIMFDRLLGKR